MAIINGLHTETAKNLQLDSGVLLHSVTTEEILALGKGDNGRSLQELIKKKTLGATKGGATFTAIPEIRSLLDGVNGARGSYIEGEVIDSWDISLKTTVSEMTASNIAYGIANNTLAVSEEHQPFTKQVGKVGRIPKEAFLSSIVWVGTINGKQTPMVIVLKGALSTNGLTFTAEDKNTGSIELEFKAHFELSKPDEVPFEIYIPNSKAQ